MSTLMSLESHDLLLSFCPQIGASITRLAWRRPGGSPPLELMPPAPRPLPSSSQASSFLMLPYANRIRDGRFAFDGEVFELDHGHKHAIHGDGRNRPWEVAEQEASRVLLAMESRRFPDLNFPFPFVAETELQLEGPCLRQTLAIFNVGRRNMPVGGGFHPYFRRQLLDPHDEVLARFQALAVYPTQGPVPLPSGPARPIPPELSYTTPRPFQVGLDHCFQGWSGHAEFHWPNAGLRMTLTAWPAPCHLVVYTPPGKDLFAFEPVSHAIDAFNLAAAGLQDTGMQVLKPGEKLELGWELRLEAAPHQGPAA